MRSEDALMARVCHDLIGPLNAVSIGVEAYRASTDASLLEGITQSVWRANALLRFMRELHSEKSASFRHTIPSLQKLIADFLASGGIDFDLTADAADIQDVFGKIMMYSTLVAKEIMPFGGVVTGNVICGDREVSVHCNGPSITVPEMNQNATPDHRNIFRLSLLQVLEKNHMSITAFSADQGVAIVAKSSV
ncbi:MAG: hypothetical protein LBB63_02625 [Holosporaceae bacterium]|jgi:histidine phosphotransferase ChpT|nr:hypothetical protein [Holosporaceae bacterium]